MSNEPRKAPCRGCGKLVIWGTTKDGKRIPLDPAPPVYSVVALEYPAGSTEEIVRVQRAPTLKNDPPEAHIREFGVPVGPWLMAAYVSHFATCPNANEFSGSRKKATV